MADRVFEQKDLAYDLRQYYAQIVGTICLKIAEARENRDFKKWFSYLEDLHTEINQKLTENNDNKERTAYRELLNKSINTITQNQGAFFGTSKDPREVSSVFNAIKELELWLKIKMDEHNIYGGGRDESGL